MLHKVGSKTAKLRRILCVTVVLASLAGGSIAAWHLNRALSLVNPLKGISLYVDPDSEAALTAQQWLSTRPNDAALLRQLASEPTAKWLTDINNLDETLTQYIAKANSANKTPLLVVYSIPLRDCGLYSAGGSQNPAKYQAFIDKLAAIVGTSKVIVVIEPDALAGIANKDTSGKACLTNSQIGERYQSLRYAVKRLSQLPATFTYLDAGNSAWGGDYGKTAVRLNKAGISMADGFSLNVSNFQLTSDTIRYGDSIAAALNGKHFIIDSSRNGLGPYDNQDNSAYTWCNPPGRALGHYPTVSTNHPLLDAYLYVKPPGESDGSDADLSKCHGGPKAGMWWPEYALGLAKRWPPELHRPAATR